MNCKTRQIACVGFAAGLAIGLSAGFGNTSQAGDYCHGHSCHSYPSGHRYGSYGHSSSNNYGYSSSSHSNNYAPTYFGGYGTQKGNQYGNGNQYGTQSGNQYVSQNANQYGNQVGNSPAPTSPAQTSPALDARLPGDSPSPATGPGPVGLPPADQPGLAPSGAGPSGPGAAGPVPPGSAPSGPASSGPTTAAVGGEAPRSDAVARQSVDFERDVRPILARHCFECHGPDSQSSGLRLDVRQAAFKGGRSGKPAIVPGNSAASRLIQVVTGRDARLTMPPDGSQLAASEIQTLSRWIDDGANWEGGPTNGPSVRTATQAPSTRG
jgi:hypothetical protein